MCLLSFHIPSCTVCGIICFRYSLRIQESHKRPKILKRLSTGYYCINISTQTRHPRMRLWSSLILLTPIFSSFYIKVAHGGKLDNINTRKYKRLRYNSVGDTFHDHHMNAINCTNFFVAFCVCQPLHLNHVFHLMLKRISLALFIIVCGFEGFQIYITCSFVSLRTLILQLLIFFFLRRRNQHQL